MAETPPAFTIRVRPRDSEKAFIFEGADGRTVSFGSKATLEQAIFEQAGLRGMLEELKSIGGGKLDLTLAQTGKALGKLDDAGKLVFYSLLGSDVLDFAADVTDLVETNLAVATAAGDVPWVHVTTADNDPIAHAIPLEMVPFTGRSLSSFVGQDETLLGEALDRFLGFVAVVRRDRGDIDGAPALMNPPTGMPVKLFQNLSLTNVRGEMDYFAKRPQFEVDGPWPVSGETLESFRTTLLAQIFDPRNRLDGSARTAPDQIQHFACHCDTFGDAQAHRFLLQGEDGIKFAMPLTGLRKELLERSQRRELADCDKPLVFLNGCGATAVDSRQLGSFAQFFLVNRNRGLVGSQIMIPDEFAVAFAEMFYSALIFERRPVGEAVLSARRKLAERRKNVLGLLYMHYGPTDLRLAACRASP